MLKRKLFTDINSSCVITPVADGPVENLYETPVTAKCRVLDENHTSDPGGNMEEENQLVAINETNYGNCFQNLNLLMAFSDSDSDCDADLHKNLNGNTNYRLPYTNEEDELIVRFVLNHQNIFRTSSISLWKHLASKKEKPTRTYQSLKNRFLRNIKPQLLTKFGHLIKNSQTLNNIFVKFPELKRNFGNKNTLKKMVLPHRKPLNFNNDEDDQNSMQAETVVNAEVNETENCVSEPSANENFCHEGAPTESSNDVGREIIINNNQIIIKIMNTRKQDKDSHKGGIYDKYLKVKAQNKIQPCRTCGRGEPEVINELVMDQMYSKLNRESMDEINHRDSVDSDSTDVMILDSYKSERDEAAPSTPGTTQTTPTYDQTTQTILTELRSPSLLLSRSTQSESKIHCIANGQHSSTIIIRPLSDRSSESSSESENDNTAESTIEKTTEKSQQTLLNNDKRTRPYRLRKRNTRYLNYESSDDEEIATVFRNTMKKYDRAFYSERSTSSESDLNSGEFKFWNKDVKRLNITDWILNSLSLGSLMSSRVEDTEQSETVSLK